MTVKRNRLLDYFAYIAIGLAVVWSAIWASDSGYSRETSYKTIGVVVNTLVVFGYLLSNHRTRYRSRSFWLILIAFLVVHFGLIAILWYFVSEIKGFWWMIIISCEIAIAGQLIERCAKD